MAADVVLLEADLRRKGDQGFKPTWLERLYFPLLQDYDLISGCFRRHYFEDPTGSLFVGPMLETFFGLRLRDPLSGVYGISRRLVEDYCADLDWWYGGAGGYGVDLWLLTQAVVWNKKICEVSLGAKIAPLALSKRAYVFKQVARSLFDCIKTNEDYWLRSQLVLKQPDVYGLEARDRAPALQCHLEDLISGFVLGFDQYSSLLKHILPEKIYKDVEKAAAKASPDLKFSDQLWSTTVYHFLQAYAFDDSAKAEDIFEGLRILYDGRIAAFIAGVNEFSDLIKEVKHLDQEDLTYEQVNRLRVNQVTEFLNGKGIYQDLGGTGGRSSTCDYTVGLSGVYSGCTVGFAKDLKGIGGLPVRTNAVFRRLEERYRQEFHRFVHEGLGLDEDLSSKEIGLGLEKFMTCLEVAVDKLLPGDLATAEGTRQVVDRVFDLIAHKKILAVKKKYCAGC